MNIRELIISKTGTGKIHGYTVKIHGYTVRFSDSIKTYHIHNYDSINQKDTQKKVNARLKKILNELIDNGEI